MPTASPAVEPPLVNSEMELIPIGKTFADHHYQRPVQETFVAKMVANFEPDLVGAIEVSYRADSERYAIIDGLQRREAMRRMGIEYVQAVVYRGLSLGEEAHLFFAKNKQRKVVAPYYGHRARILARVPEALHIEEIVKAEGFVLAPKTNHEEEIGAVVAITEAYRYPSKVRSEPLSRTLRTIKHSFYGQKSSTEGDLIRAIARIAASYSDEEIDWPTLEQALYREGPGGIRDSVRARALREGIAGSKATGVMGSEEIVKAYNRMAPNGKKLNLGQLRKTATLAQGAHRSRRNKK